MSAANFAFGTDDTTAIQTLHSYCNDNGIPFRYEAGEHIVRGQVQMLSSGDASAAKYYINAFDFAGDADPVVLRVGTTTPDDRINDLSVRTPLLDNVTHEVGDGWSGYDDVIGIELGNVNFGDIHNLDVYGVGVGVRLSGYDAGAANNELHLKGVISNKIGIELFPGDDTGWTNQNNFHGGQIGIGSGETTTGTRYLHLHQESTNTNAPPNNNNFFGVNFEGITPEYTVECQGRYNQWVGCRWEHTTVRFLQTGTSPGQSLANLVVGGYNSEAIEFSSGGADTLLFTGMVSPRETVIYGGQEGLKVGTSTGNAYLRAFAPGVNPLTKDASATDWQFEFRSNRFEGKDAADANPRITLYWDDLTPRIVFGDGASAASAYIGYGGSSTVIDCNATFAPVADDTFGLGFSTRRWTQVWATTGTIQTSDAREKEWRGGLDEAELRVAKRLSKLVGIYQWKSAIEKKGDDARLHCGVTAQDVKAAFEAEGLDGFRYGVLCYDEWEAAPAELDEDGSVLKPARDAGDRYGVRYDELWAFVATGFEARLAALEDS